MKSNIFIIVIFTVIIFGSSLVLFVYKMSWFPPHHREMIMERKIIFNNMAIWIGRTYLVIISIIILIVIGLKIYDYFIKEKN